MITITIKSWNTKKRIVFNRVQKLHKCIFNHFSCIVKFIKLSNEKRKQTYKNNNNNNKVTIEIFDTLSSVQMKWIKNASEICDYPIFEWIRIDFSIHINIVRKGKSINLIVQRMLWLTQLVRLFRLINVQISMFVYQMFISQINNEFYYDILKFQEKW